MAPDASLRVSTKSGAPFRHPEGSSGAPPALLSRLTIPTPACPPCLRAQMVSGKTPFGDLHWAQLVSGLIAGDLKLEWPPDAHLAIKKLGQACMAAEPAQRPTAAVLAKVCG